MKKWIVVLLLVAVAGIGAIAIFSYATQDTLPVSYTFDTTTGEVVFAIGDGFTLHDIYQDNGLLQLPETSKETRLFALFATSIPVGKSETITIRCDELVGEPHLTKSVSYEILRQAEDEIIIMRYELSFLKDSQKYRLAS